MCGRYFIDDEAETMIRLFERIKEVQPQFDFGQMATKEIFPTQTCLTLQGTTNLQPKLMKWGYPKYDGKGVIINARSESILEKPTFRTDVQTSRCLIISSGFFEWDANKTRHTIRGDEDILYMAGIYRQDADLPHFAIVTKASTGPMKDIHDRMPILLRRQDIQQWQGEDYRYLLGR